MRAAVYHGPGDIRIEQVPDPRIEQPTDAIVSTATVSSAGRARRGRLRAQHPGGGGTRSRGYRRRDRDLKALRLVVWYHYTTGSSFMAYGYQRLLLAELLRGTGRLDDAAEHYRSLTELLPTDLLLVD